jgi:hypothetical protein
VLSRVLTLGSIRVTLLDMNASLLFLLLFALLLLGLRAYWKVTT